MSSHRKRSTDRGRLAAVIGASLLAVALACGRASGGPSEAGSTGAPASRTPRRTAHDAAAVRDTFQGKDCSKMDLQNPLDQDSSAVAAGDSIFHANNCNGCHGTHGGGGMGPNLRDQKWRFGGEDACVFQTIHDGRPGGMPTWGPHFTTHQIWELVSYVHSFGGYPPALKSHGK